MRSPASFPMVQALLGFLMQGPAHGYALHQRAEEELGRIWYMGMSNVYATLKDLESAGHVEAALDEGTYPPRKVYSITPAGRAAFSGWVRKPVHAVRDMRVELLAKLYFLQALELEGALSLLRAQRSVCRRRLEGLEQDASADPADVFGRTVTDFRRRRIRSSIRWLRACEEEWR